MSEPRWLEWIRELQAMAQTGLTFTHDPYDRERYRRLRALAAEMLAAGTGEDFGHVHSVLERDVGYATPKVDVRGAVFRGDRILLVREVSDGGWCLPGGWADVNQSPTECVEREILEESGFKARAVKVVALHDYRRQGHTSLHPHSIYKLFFLCEMLGGEARTSLETDGVDFFRLQDLPTLSIGRTNPGQLQLMFEHRLNPQLPTEFH
jgi:ADP-ribose pyrophosphatase YjhB (NUDIX family)